MAEGPQVGVVMGSDSDLPCMQRGYRAVVGGMDDTTEGWLVKPVEGL